MAYIRQIPDDEATGLLAKLYGEAIERAGKVFNIVRLMSQNPRVMRDAMAVYKSTMFAPSPLSRARREMLATVVSRVNDCFY